MCVCIYIYTHTQSRPNLSLRHDTCYLRICLEIFIWIRILIFVYFILLIFIQNFNIMRNPLYCAFFILKFYSYVQYFSRLNVALCAGPI